MACACLLYRNSGADWPPLFILFLWPDLAMTTAGHPAHPRLFAFALIWIAHIGFDRALGYGLKYPTFFKETHLQRVN